MISPMRRTTIPVARSKMQETQRFYEEVLGMQVFYEGHFESEGEAALLGLNGKCHTRLVVLQQGEETTGMIGLMEYVEPEFDIKPFAKPADGPFPVIFVFMVDDMDELYAKVQAFGCRVVCPPTVYPVPGRGDSIGMTCLDPNGVLLDFTQFRKEYPPHDID